MSTSRLSSVTTLKRRQLCGGVSLTLLLGACAQLPRSPRPASSDLWSGRLSLRVQSDPPQSLSAAFELKGTADQGELRLSTPLGTTLLSARWTANEALLDAGNQTQRYANIDTLVQQTTGASLPVGGLFDWLRGQPSQADGWVADLSRHASGRISARRLLPAPVAELRIVLDAAP